ncbi:hypothetical protein F5B20DRAFT_580478 [Whalleya microplaca]|nr:hypothetical protein F5B20DRAFT_580478 [Whalleya microplaca]
MAKHHLFLEHLFLVVVVLLFLFYATLVHNFDLRREEEDCSQMAASATFRCVDGRIPHAPRALRGPAVDALDAAVGVLAGAVVELAGCQAGSGRCFWVDFSRCCEGCGHDGQSEDADELLVLHDGSGEVESGIEIRE